VHCIDDKQIAPLRSELIRRLRAEIAADVYPDEAVIDAAVDRVLACASRGGDEEAAAAWDESNAQDRFDGGRLS
jgi:hypothetical protein